MNASDPEVKGRFQKGNTAGSPNSSPTKGRFQKGNTAGRSSPNRPGTFHKDAVNASPSAPSPAVFPSTFLCRIFCLLLSQLPVFPVRPRPPTDGACLNRGLYAATLRHDGCVLYSFTMQSQRKNRSPSGHGARRTSPGGFRTSGRSGSNGCIFQYSP